jgi:predicted lipoprotein
MICVAKLKQFSLILVGCTLLNACDVVKLDENGKAIIPMTAEEAASFDNMTPDALANKFWPEVLSEAHAKSVAEKSFSFNGAKSLFMRLSGTIEAVDVSKKNATMTLHTDDRSVLVNIGPIIRGNAIRDAATFIIFDDFKNQVQFARLSKSLNQQAMEHFIRPDESWVGESVDVLAAVTIKDLVITEAIPLEIVKR